VDALLAAEGVCPCLQQRKLIVVRIHEPSIRLSESIVPSWEPLLCHLRIPRRTALLAGALQQIDV